MTTIPVQQTTLADLPMVRASERPDGACISDERRALDNAAFHTDVTRLAAHLTALGVVSGDVVAVMLPNCCEIVTSMFAVWRIGAALTPVNPALTDTEVSYQLQDCSTRVLIGDDRSRELAARLGVTYMDAALIHDRVGLTGSRADASGEGSISRQQSVVAADDFAFVVYSSGTTGTPKGCLLDHSNVSAMVDSISTSLGLDETDSSLLVLPLFHCNGLVVGVLSVLKAGGAVVVGPRFDPTTFWDSVETHRPTFFSAVPTMYALLESRTSRVVDTSSLRFVVCGAAPMSPELIDRFEKRFGVPIVEGYGLSEGTVASTLNPVTGLRKPGTVGLPLPGQEVEIESPDGVRLPNGEKGEVVIRGANVMRGYLGRPDATATVLQDGWLHTGDVGYLDSDGYLVLVDRLKDMIIRGGENIFPKEIEAVLYAYPNVLEAAVVGQSDAIYGEVPVAYIAPRPGRHIDAEELREHCRANLARFKIPREFHILASLPKNAVGKLMKSALKA